MSSRKYISYKFFYDDDLGRTTIKRHRSYLNEDGIEDTPTTQLFRDRIVESSSKIMGTSTSLRHLLTYIGTRKLIAKIPYSPANPRLNDHIKEILAVPRVICGDYRGETQITNGIRNSFSE